jgi:MYXO-CTERM domain-containing protein
MTTTRSLLLTLPILACVAGSAHAAIVSTGGAATQIAPPPACVPGALTGFIASAWDESQNRLFSALPVNESQNPGGNVGAVPAILSGTYDSHLIHFEPLPGAIGAIGIVTFSTPIAGVMFINTTLDATDASCGAFGTVYPTGFPPRGLNAASNFSYAGNVLQFQFAVAQPTNDVIQLRVLTHSVPAPGAVGLAAMGGLLVARRRRGE